jgi:hypothetical protein
MSRNTIGTDPEFFIKDSKGKYVNAEKMFPGTKEAPHKMKSGAGLQTDNVAVEFASPVAKNGEDFVKKLRNTFNELFKMIPEDHVVDFAASALFPEEELQTPQAQLFGCSASYCAWALKENDQPCATQSNLRSTGAHIHIGKVKDDGNDFLYDPYGKVNTVRMCDALHGIISVLLDTNEASIRRRELYGKAGEHRPTEYGVEYRALSSFWLKSPNLVMMIDSLTQDAVRVVREEKHEELVKKLGGGDNIQHIINTGDTAKAEIAVNEVLLKYMSKDSKYFFEECRKAIDTYNFKKEWSIGQN